MRDRRRRRVGDHLAGAALASLWLTAGDEAGVTAIEYAFIAVVAAVTTLGTGVSGLFNSVLGGF
jgi:hypothetical protein